MQELLYQRVPAKAGRSFASGLSTSDAEREEQEETPENGGRGAAWDGR